MRTDIPAGLFNAGAVQTIAALWIVTGASGAVKRGTDHDSAIAITAGLYAGTYQARVGTRVRPAQSPAPRLGSPRLR